MALLTRQQAAQSWVEADPTVQFGASPCLEHYKDVSTEYGLNLSVQHGWRFGDPHRKTAAPDRTLLRHQALRWHRAVARAPVAQPLSMDSQPGI